MKMEKFYTTFGQIHVHKVNSKRLHSDVIGVIEAKDYEDARAKAFEWFDGKFHNMYTQKEWDKKLEEDIMQFFPDGFVNINF